MDDYIGGRYSSTSAVSGAVLSLLGPDVFAQFLKGAGEDALAKNEIFSRTRQCWMHLSVYMREMYLVIQGQLYYHILRD